MARSPVRAAGRGLPGEEIWAGNRSRRCGGQTRRARRRQSCPPGPASARRLGRRTLVLLDGGHDAGGRFQGLASLFTPDLRHGLQHAPKAGPAVAVVAGKIGAAEVGPAIGSEKCGERPAPLSADG